MSETRNEMIGRLLSDQEGFRGNLARRAISAVSRYERVCVHFDRPEDRCEVGSIEHELMTCRILEAKKELLRIGELLNATDIDSHHICQSCLGTERQMNEDFAVRCSTCQEPLRFPARYFTSHEDDLVHVCEEHGRILFAQKKGKATLLPLGDPDECSFCMEAEGLSSPEGTDD